MNAKIVFPVVSLSLLGSFAHAQAKNVYTCTVRVFDADSNALIEQSFQADEDNGPHGGDGQAFKSKDGSTEADVTVDGKWMLLTWIKNGKTVASGTFVLGSSTTDARAAIFYNPENSDEQMALDCEPNFQL